MRMLQICYHSELMCRAADQTMVVEEELERLLTIREYLKAKQVFHIGSK